MQGSVGDPVLLGQHCGRSDHDFLCLVVVGRESLHFNGIVAEPELGQCEAPDHGEVLDSLGDRFVPFGPQGNDRASEEIILDCELGRKGTIDIGSHLVISENLQGLIEEIKG